MRFIGPWEVFAGGSRSHQQLPGLAAMPIAITAKSLTSLEMANYGTILLGVLSLNDLCESQTKNRSGVASNQSRISQYEQ